jgi:ABC-type transport system involved in multi-copper enzyme maturation permease subunit
MTSSEALPEDAARPSPLRAWLFLIWLSWQRQARAREMVWLAIALLGLASVMVSLTTQGNWWGLQNRRTYGRGGPTYKEWLERSEATWRAIPFSSPATSITMAVNAVNSAILEQSDFLNFTRGFIFLLFFTFLVPIWSLAFATEAFGGERESHGMIWLLTRPLSRPAIYLAKFIAVLPWCIGLNVGGFALLCALAGRPGPIAFRLFWPAVLWSSLTFCALFFLFGAFFRRPAIVALVYSFFLEVIIGNMPGTLKRASVGFYARCMMFDEAAERGISPDNPVVYDPVSGSTALWVLILATLFLLLLGMFLFRRAEYHTGD